MNDILCSPILLCLGWKLRTLPITILRSWCYFGMCSGHVMLMGVVRLLFKPIREKACDEFVLQFDKIK